MLFSTYVAHLATRYEGVHFYVCICPHPLVQGGKGEGMHKNKRSFEINQFDVSRKF